MSLENICRAAALVSILVAGSCTTEGLVNDGSGPMSDPSVNHPIAVEPTYREIKVNFSGPQGMSPDDAVKFDNFLADYRAHGNGSLAIAVPAGAPSHAAITFFAERAASTGISRDKILVSTHDVADNDFRVDLSYITYTARTAPCGDWSEDLATVGNNLTAHNFGCSVQQNIAAQVADPRDLLGPRRFDPADATRAAVVMDNYEQGKPTAAQKTQEQSGAVSDINK